jgi:hypothetical protein
VWCGRVGETPPARTGPTSWECRARKYRRTGTNLWVPADIDPVVPEQRIVEAGAQLPSYGAVTGWAGLRWLGGWWFDGIARGELMPVPLAVSLGHAMRRTLAVAPSQEGLPPRDVRRVDGLRVTPAVRSVAFEMRKAVSDEAAVVAFEMAAFNDLVSIAELEGYVETDMPTRQGVERLRRLLRLLDENSWSPTEPVMRWRWHGATGLMPRANVPVFDRQGRFVATPDLIDEERGVYGQYDGALHLLGEVRQRDVTADAGLRAIGLESVVMMAGDLGDDSAFLWRLDQAYARAQRRPASDRGWTTTPPTWWVPTLTVAQRRALSDADRARLLAHRRRAA